MAEILEEIVHRKRMGDLNRKRVACANCGTTWIELVGLIVEKTKGTEDLCLRIGLESDICQTCRHRVLECQRCGSKDVYEIVFVDANIEQGPLSFKGIKKVSKNSGDVPIENHSADIEVK